MLRRLLCATACIVLAVPARAELVSFEQSASGVRARVKIDGATFDLEPKIARPQNPAAGAPLFLDTAATDDLASFALRRGMIVVSLDLAQLPAAARAQALRDLLPRLRQSTGAKRVLARGKGESGAALAQAGALVEGLMLQRVGPFAAPLDPRGPRVIEIFGSDAYWRPGPTAIGAEAEEGANRRRFLVAGATGAGAGAENCAASPNARSIEPASRALLVALDAWTKGVKPPASRAPRLRDGGLVAAKNLVWPKIPGFPAPPAGARPVPKIDADGNELAGLRLPDHALPLATFTGFNAQKDKAGPACAGGAAFPFPSTRAEREKRGDPRPSLVERYGSRAYFVATMRVVADRLVRERLLLQEDADAYVAAAKTAPF